MFIDAQMMFSNNQALSATGASTNILDFGAAARNLFDGGPLAIVLLANVAAAGGGTYQVDVQTSNDPAFGSFTTLSSSIIPATKLVVGTKVVLPISVGSQVLEYVRLYYTLGGTSPSVTVEAFLEPLQMIEKVVYYADKSPIS